MSLVGARGATVYVSTTGSDSNPGTAAQPFRTITYAYSQVGPGTTILVAPGTYTDYTSGWGLHLGKSGTASSPIVLQSQVRGGAVIDGQFASDRNTGIYIDGTYNVVIGFGITRAPTTGVVLYGNSNQILNDEIYNNGTQGSTDPEGQGIYSGHGTSGNVYDGNYIHDNGYAGSNLDHGLYLCGQNEVVANNVVLRNAAYGLQIAGYNTVSGMKVYNNVFAYNGKSGIILWMSLNGVDIENNIIYKNGILGIDSYEATGSGVVVDHNLVFGNGSGNYDFTDSGSDYSYSLGTTISSDPLFANDTSSGFDAHLSAGSPAIGAGLNLSSVFTYDLADAPRPSTGAWDLGAYVYGASTVTNIAPPTVSITSPTSAATVSGGISVLANASSSVGITGVQFELDGADIGPVFTNAPYGGAWDSTTAADGAHTFTAVATDTTGKQTTSTPVTILVSNTVSTLGLPIVSVGATTPNASRVGPADGVFTLTRSGSTSAPLIVYYTLGGTATNGTDYAILGASLTIPAGAASAAITVAPLPSSNLVGKETAVLALSANSTYAPGSAMSATVTIGGNSVPSTIGNAPGHAVKITWKSVAGKIYVVADKTSLSEPTWTNLSGSITATGSSTSYTDTTVNNHNVRYYLVYVTD
jgi:hypothetical protein